MTGKQQHIIQKQILEIQGATPENRQYWEEHIRKVQKDRIIPLLQEVFDKVSNHNVHIRLDSLEVTIPPKITFKEQEELKTSLVQQIQDQIVRQNHSGRSSQSPTETYQEGFSFFLQHGYFPWWVDRTQTDFLQKAKQTFLALPIKQIKTLSVKWLSTASICRRLIAHFTEDELRKLANAHFQAEIPERIFQFIQKLASNYPHKRVSIWYEYFSLQSLQGWVHYPETLSLWTYANKLENTLNYPVFTFTSIVSKEGLAKEARKDLIAILGQHSANTFEYAPLWLDLQDLATQTSIQEKDLVPLYKKGFHSLRLLALLLKQLEVGSSSRVLPLLTSLVKKLSSSWKNEWETYHRHVAVSHSKEPHIHTLEGLLTILIQKGKAYAFIKKYGPDCLETLIKERLYSGSKRTSTSAQVPKRKAPSLADDSIPVSNAGIVLLAPFIPTLFQKAGLIEKGNFISDESIQKAISLLYYLAKGELRGEEQDYLFMKLLCTGHMDIPLDYELDIQQEELTEADQMLEAVCLHGKTAWGNMSAPSIRKLFIHRTGLLTVDPYQWSLQVERKDEDILLGKVPWGFQHVRFSWLHKTISVEW